MQEGDMDDEMDIEHAPLHKEKTTVDKGNAVYTGFMKAKKLKGDNIHGFEFV